MAVQADFVPPFASAGFDVLLNCYNPTGTLLGTGSSIGPEYAYEWLLGGVVVGGGLSLPVSDVGDFTLTVTNTQNGCERLRSGVRRRRFPDACGYGRAGFDDRLYPAERHAQRKWIFEWTRNKLRVVPGWSGRWGWDFLSVDDPGNYTLTVLNTDNGCSATDEALVESTKTFPKPC
ncbi:MAG: hypothetical protein IPJ00_18550 [Saprospirales bacterium]|nr:hypothetical protein [Saprospirales bacterium]